MTKENMDPSEIVVVESLRAFGDASVFLGAPA